MYIIKNSLDSKTIGTIYDQIQSIEKSITSPPSQFTSLYPQFNPATGKYDDSVMFPIYKMQNKAKHTDLLSNVPLNYLCKMISNNFYNFLTQFKLPEHQIFQGQFVHKKILYDDYKIIFFVRKEATKQCVDWKNSFFYKTQNWHKEILQELKYDNWDEMWAAKDKIRAETFGFMQGHIRIKPDCLNFDLFNFGRYPLPMGFICSGKLKNVIEKEGFTGMEFEPMKPIFSFS